MKDFQFTQFFKKVDQKDLIPFGVQPIRILFIAKSAAGKSFVARYIQYLLKFCIQKNYVICPTEIDQQFYQKYTNKAKIMLKPDIEKIEQIIQQQQRIVSQLRQKRNKQQFKNVFLYFVPHSYIENLQEYYEQIDQEVEYLSFEEITQKIQNTNKNPYQEYSQYVASINMVNYYKLIYFTVDIVIQLVKEKKIDLLQKALNLDDNQIKKLNSVNIMPLITHQFQKINPSCFFIFDDCISDPEFMKNPVVIGLLTEGRHRMISTLFITQHLNKVKNDMRSNFGHVIISAQNNDKIVKEIQQQFLSDIQLQQFKPILQQYTKDYGCILIDLVEQRYQNPLDKLYYIKAPDLSNKNFFIGSIKEQIQNTMTKQISFDVEQISTMYTIKKDNEKENKKEKGKEKGKENNENMFENNLKQLLNKGFSNINSKNI